MEYSFIVHAGGKVGDIQIQWNGTEASKALANGGFKFSNSLGTIKESAPKSFAGGKMVESSFEKKGFKVGNYDKKKDLVIDPVIVWGTYFGGDYTDDAQGVCSDIFGNVYMVGNSYSYSSGYYKNAIATSGAYQTSFGGNSSDAFLTKFSSSGSLLWATYYGGAGNDVGNGIAADPSGNVYITGNTTSPSGIATSGAFITSFSGNQDAFLAKFASSGALVWGAYFGGASNDISNGVATDGSGNVFITGETGSDSLASSGAYQTSNSGEGDVFLAKFNSGGVRQWSTYYGGTKTDEAFGISIDLTGNIFITGTTNTGNNNYSNSGIATSGAYLTSYAGASASFVAKFSNSGSLDWGTYYIGESVMGISISTDASGNAYIAGQTFQSSGIATSGAYQTSYGGDNLGAHGCAFLAKFNSIGGLSWSTYYGSDLDAANVSADIFGNVYLTGGTDDNNSVEFAVRTFLARFDSSGKHLLYAINYGGKDWSLPTGICSDHYGNVYTTGKATGSSIATSGAFQTSDKASVTDEDNSFLIRFSILHNNDAGIDSVQSPKGSFCGGTHPLTVHLTNFGFNTLTKVNIPWSINGKMQTVYSWTGSLKSDSSISISLGAFSFPPGNDTIRAWTSSPNGVLDSASQNDSFMAIAVNLQPSASVIANTAICYGSAISIGAAPITGNTYSWVSSPSGFSTTSSNPSVSPVSGTSYTLTETNANGCSNSNSVSIGVNPVPGAKIEGNASICSGTSISLGFSPVVGSTYAWTSSPAGFTSTSSDPIVSPTTTTAYTMTETNSSSCSTSRSLTITAQTLPAAAVIANTVICSGNTISIGASAVAGSSYSWASSASGFSSSSSNPTVSPTSTTAYTLTETAANGCSKSTSVTISIFSAFVIANAAICPGASVSIGGLAVTGSIYSWSPSTGLNSTAISDPSAKPTSTTTYTLTETNTNGCIASNSVTVTINALPLAIAGSSATICSGTLLSLGAAPVTGSTYSWYPPSSISPSNSSKPTANPNVTTTYTLTEINANGCLKSNSVTITVNGLPAAKTNSNSTICSGSSYSIGSPPVAGSTYTWSSSQSGFDSTSSNPSVSPTATTTYTVTETNINGCTKSNSIAVTVGTPAAAIISNATICSGMSISLGVAPVTGSSYSWASSPSGFSYTGSNPTVSPTSTTSYSITETNSNGCVKTDSTIITVNALSLPAAAVASNSSICAGAAIPIGASAVAGSSYSWSPSAGLGSTTASNPSASPTSTTTYTLTETNSNGCSKSNSVTINVNAPTVAVISNATICSGAAISIGAAPVPGSTYSWSPSTALNSTTVSNPTANPTSTTIYTVTETNVSGCSKSNSVIITVNTLPSASVISNTSICSGAAISIGSSAVSGSTYSWASSIPGFSSTSSNPSVSPTSTSSYTLTETNSSGCIKSNSVTISINTLPSAAIISNSTVCSGTTISIGASAVTGSTYLWASSISGFTSTSSNPSVSPTTTASFSVTETNSNGCVKSNSLTISINALPAATVASNLSICAGDKTTIGAAPIAGSTYTWSPSTGLGSTIASNPSAFPASSTTYTLTETNSKGCVKSNSVTITVNPSPAAAVISNTTICSGSAISIGATAVSGSTYSWASSVSGFNSTSSNPSISPTSTSTYTLTETNTSGCFKSNSVTINVNNIPAASVIANSAICSGAAISIGATAVTGSAYSWTSSATGFNSTISNPTVSPTSTTSYTLTETNSSGCINSNSVTITVNAQPDAAVISNTTICSGTLISIGASAVTGSSYIWTSSVTGFSSTSSNPSVSPTSAVSYTLTEKTSKGCSNSNSVTITVNPLPVAQTTSPVTICTGLSVHIGSTAVTGSTYSWSPSTGLSSSTVSNPIATPISTTVYTLTETNNYGCSKSNSVHVALNPLPAAAVISNTAICAGSSISIGASPVAGDTYSWSPSTGLSSSTVSNPVSNPASVVTYTLTEKTSFGCSNSNSVTISVSTPSASVISNTAICTGSPISIGATAVTGSSYSWAGSVSGFGSTSSNPIVSPTSTASYTLTETNANGCFKSNSVTITVNALPTAAVISNTAICSGSAISIGASAVTGSSYFWAGSVSGFASTSSNPTVSPASTASYTLTETNANGCVNSNSTIITVNALPAAAVISNTPICSGAVISIGGSAVAGSSYSWAGSVSGFSSTISNPTVSPTSTASYTLTETNVNGCVKSNSIIITVNALPAAAVISNTAICSGSAISIGASAVTGSSYSWAGSVSGFSSTISNPSVSPTSTSSYTLTETNANGCINSNSTIITVNALPAAAVISNASICSGATISIGASAVSGSNYSWTSSVAGFSSTISNPSVSPGSTASYTLTETNANGCIKSNSITITVNALPAATVISNTAICSGAAISIGASAVTGSSYSWTSSVSGFSSTVSNPSVSPTSTASYTVTETNANACSKSNSVTISVNSLPAASVISNTVICSGAAISIGASAVTGSSYSWASSISGYSSSLSNPSVSPSSMSSYTLTETNANGCTNSNSVIITVNALPAASVISTRAICSGAAISIGASPVTGSTYSWVSSASAFSSTVSNPSVSPTSTTTYTLTETNSNGCSKSNSVTITVNSLPAAAVISNTAICSGSTISIGGTSVFGSTYSWTSSPSGFTSFSSNPSVSPTSATKYKLTETNSKGCSGSDSVSITVNPLPSSSFFFTNVCPGDSSPFIDSSTLATSYNWYFGDGGTSSLANPKHLYSAIGNYTVSLKVTSSGVCTDSVSKTLSLSSCVWPGDANGDKVVDMKDLLAIGIAYGTVGHLRPYANINWTAQPSPDWDSSFSNGVNYKNADCNGDSTVNDKDTLAISANYGLSHSKSGGLNQGSSSDPGFNIKYLKDTFYAGDTLIAQIILGSTSKPVINLYGLAFSIALDPAIFESNKAFLKVNPSFLGTKATDLIAMTKNNTSAGVMDIGISRINQLNASGNGTIAILYLPVKRTLSQKYLKAILSLSNNYQISYNQKPVSLYLTSDSVLVKQDHTGIENAKTSEAFSLSIFPNPFQSTTTITYNLNHNSKINIVLIDVTGKQIGTIVNENQVPGNYQFDINAEKYHLNPGIYLMKFMMDDEAVSRRLVKF